MSQLPPVRVTDWTPAPFDLGGETVFAVGDVHGCLREFDALLASIRSAAAEAGGQRRLIFLGDMIDRGPDTLGVLKRWAEPERARGVDRIDRVFGNHEQLLLLAITGGPHAAKTEAMWRSQRMGGESVMAELGETTIAVDVLERAIGADAVDKLKAMRPHVEIGNTLFVHGGLDPKADPKEYLSPPWTSFMDANYAWIQEGFLDWRGGYGGRLVVHGHTPPAKHKAISGQEDPHRFMYDRLGLDGGTTVTGLVVGAEIRNGSYRVFRAGTPRAA